MDLSTLATDYDMANRLIHEQEDIGAGLKALSYQYTPDSLVSQWTYPGGTVAARTDNTHRLVNEGSSSPAIASRWRGRFLLPEGT